MPKYKNYINKHTKNGDIHTIENIVNMSFGDVARREKELESQYNQIGIPSDADMQNSSNVVFVHEYTRDDGTIVRAHWRSKPENNGTDNYTSKRIIDNQKEIDNQSNFSNTIISTPKDNYNPQLYGHIEISDIENDVLRKPFDVIHDFINKAKNNNTDYSVPKTKWEQIQEKIYSKWFKKFLPMASEATENGMNNMSAAKKDINAIIYTTLNDIKDKDLKNSLKKYGAKSTMKGVYYNSKSNSSKIISKSSELMRIVNDLCKNGGKTSKTSLEFKFDPKHPKESFDRYASIQHAKIHNPHISADGNYMKCSIIDVSDFEKRQPTLSNIPNNWGYNMQEKGLYKNYFQIYEIEVPLTNKQRKLLQKRKNF